MRRQIKLDTSEVIAKDLKYLKDNSGNNKKIRIAMLQEQKSFCAYTEEYISSTDAADIEHFNPTLKYTDDDGYHNWYIVKHKFNQGKLAKWEDLQPIMLPTDNNFEDRIIYDHGDYLVNSEDDIAAANLITLLKLDDAHLAANRKKYVARKRNEMADCNQGPSEFFQKLIQDYPAGINYIRAIEEEFEIDIWGLL